MEQNNIVTGELLKRIDSKIRDAESALGKPLPGSKLDLIADNFDLLTRDIEWILIYLDHRCGVCRKDKDPSVPCNCEFGVL